MRILKSLLVWLCFIPAAILNGGVAVLPASLVASMGLARKRCSVKRTYHSLDMATITSRWHIESKRTLCHCLPMDGLDYHFRTYIRNKHRTNFP